MKFSHIVKTPARYFIAIKLKNIIYNELCTRTRIQIEFNY